MKKPWQVWLLFLLCIILVVPAMGWLSVMIVQQDRLRESDRVDTELARQEAELQDLVNSALYRMDWRLSPIVAREAARPYYLYNAFYRVGPELGGKGSKGSPVSFDQLQPSPLLDQNSEFVKLHFQVNAENRFTSPQRPETALDCKKAIACSTVTPSMINLNTSALQEVEAITDFKLVYALCPENEPGELAQGQSNFRNLNIQEELAFEPNSRNVELANDNNKQQVQQMTNALRGVNEFNRRQSGNQSYALNWAATNPVSKSKTAREGVMRPFWIGEELFLGRRVAIDGEEVVQCCWLDWTKIEQTLRSEVKDILPDVKFAKLDADTQPDYGRALATLPVQVSVDAPKLLSSLSLDRRSFDTRPISGLKWAMILAWCGLGLAACAVGGLLFGVMKLSERRASFVSAVTHELRTPLTTFKMYSEMLADEMVPPEKQQHYAKTLQTQADRLTHLVDNVLQFARLEKGNTEARDETVTCGDLIQRFENRLSQRCQHAGMELAVDFLGDTKELEIRTDPQVIEQIVFNLVDNACKYAAAANDKRVKVTMDQHGNELMISVRDFGPGVDEKFRRRMFQPFCKSDIDAANSAPGVGLGLALCKRMAKSIGGSIDLRDVDPGADFVLRFGLNSR